MKFMVLDGFFKISQTVVSVSKKFSVLFEVLCCIIDICWTVVGVGNFTMPSSFFSLIADVFGDFGERGFTFLSDRSKCLVTKSRTFAVNVIQNYLVCYVGEAVDNIVKNVRSLNHYQSIVFEKLFDEAYFRV
ncbi:hypothetical protein ACROYT_G028846, partial [Oculina patagonica]